MDLTDDGANDAMRQRDEFNFSVGIQFGETPVEEVRHRLVELSQQQHARTRAAAAAVHVPTGAGASARTNVS